MKTFVEKGSVVATAADHEAAPHLEMADGERGLAEQGDEAILDGDYVLVEKTKTAHNGDIVVALLESSDATLKRFFREGDNIRLQPSNVAMKPIIVPAATVEIQGRVIGVLRKY